MDENFNPRTEGKHHWHEEEVRPFKVSVKNSTMKNPLTDLYMDNQDRKHRGRAVSLPMRSIEIHLTEMVPHEKSRLHKHHDEAAIYIVKGKGYSEIQGVRYDWEEGDFLYVPPMAWHTHINLTDDTAVYMGITNKKLLNYLGLERKVECGIHMTEEAVQKEIASEKFSPYSWVNVDPDTGVSFGPEKKLR